MFDLPKFLKHIAGAMTPENWARFRQELIEGAEGEDEQGYQGDPEYYESEKKGAMDSRGFYKRYPEAQPVRKAGIATDARASTPVSAKAMAGFYERYPEAKTTRGA